MAAKTAAPSIQIASSQVSTNSVTSKDGTTIGYYQIGQGPALIILHGAAESAKSHLQLAESLADTFTVILPDRRGRGLSGTYGKDYSVQRDVDDMDALLTKTGAHDVMGVSSGAIIWLKALLTLSTIQKAVIFEPPLSINGSVSTDFLARYDSEIAQSKTSDALVTGMLGAQMGPAIFSKLPRWLLKLLTTMMMKSEDKSAKKDDVTMRMLAPTLHYDFQLVREVSPDYESFRAIRAEVLLLGGSQSPTYLKTALNALEKILPHITRIELPGVGHGATGNQNRGGQPDKVSQEIRRFLA